MILIISTCADKLSEQEFVWPIARIVKNGYVVRHFTEGKKIKNIDKYDKIIICGTALKDNDYQKDLTHFDWLETNAPVLGICSGMQILGMYFGGKLVKQKRIGMGKIKTIVDNPLFKGEFDAYELHGFTVDGDFEYLAEDKKAFRKDNKYGIIFHPEVRNEQIIRNFIGTDF